MDFERISVNVARKGAQLRYSCIHVRPADKSGTYVLFLHGFPSLPIDFRRQITYLTSKGYGVIAPELLGYGGTSHPAETDLYRLKLMASDVVHVLDHLGIPQVHAVGHDWGVTLLSRLEFYYPQRIAKMALLTIGVAPFGQPFDLDAVNSMTKEKLGYEGYGYMAFLTRDADAADIINSHQESFRSLMYGKDTRLWKQYFGAAGGLKSWLVEDLKSETLLDKFDEKMQEAHRAAFSDANGAYTATLNWYFAHVSNHNVPDEQAELTIKGLPTYQTTKPVLQILVSRDPTAIAPIHEQMTRTYAPNASITTFDAGHFVMIETAQEVSEQLEAFFAAEER